MSKALIIKGANFAANKVETITLSDVIPCTGLDISDDTVALTEIGATLTLIATPTPSNTTDTITWASSDDDVATVIDGVVSAVGVGSAIITAYCGTYSAVCNVVVTVSFSANSKFYLNCYELSGTNLSATPPKDYVTVYAASTRRVYGDPNNVLDGYKAYSGNNGSLGLDVIYPFAIPNGTKKISATFPVGFTKYMVALLNANEYPTYETTRPGARVIDITSLLDAVDGTFEYSLPATDGYNSFVFMLRTASESADAVTGDVIITLS